MSESVYVGAAIVVSALVTFGLRLAPFLVRRRLIGSPFMGDFGRWMPAGAMVILAMYVTAGVEWHDPHKAKAYGAGLIVTIALHLWRKNMIISMVGGTVVCAVLASIGAA